MTHSIPRLLHYDSTFYDYDVNTQDSDTFDLHCCDLNPCKNSDSNSSCQNKRQTTAREDKRTYENVCPNKAVQ